MKLLLQNILDGLSGKTAKPTARQDVDSPTVTTAAPVAEAASIASSAVAPLGQGLAYNSTGEQYEEFLKLMKLGKRPFRKPGLSVMQEYELWLAHQAATAAAAVKTAEGVRT